MRVALFLFFLASGFCSLVYQIVWLRLGMAAFGVNTAIVSIVLSVFMAGLAAGSWGAGAWLRSAGTSPAAALRLYAAAELAIGLSAWLVPAGFASGGRRLGALAGGWASATHFAAAGVWLTLVLLPFCIAMGATIPLALRAVEGPGRADSGERSFSYLYAANVAGAALGTLLSAFVLIELFGFQRTLRLTAGLNFLIAAVAAVLAWRRLSAQPIVAESARQEAGRASPALYAALFSTGLVSMAVEVVWIRQYTPLLGTMVYAFAGLLAVYLVATFAGSLGYRALAPAAVARWEGRAWLALPLAAVLPLAVTDPRLALGGVGAEPGDISGLEALLRLLLGIGPFSALTGFLTPRLVDRGSAGRPRAAGRAYAVNVVGCIVGPLVAGFVLLPLAGERASTLLLTLPLLACAVAMRRPWPQVAIAAACALGVVVATRGFESTLPGATVRRDATATVIATGRGMERRLLVNGVGMTHLTPITKMMAHLPLAFRPAPPARGTLVICLGIGTSLRSAVAWGAPATAVELVPSVVALAPFFFPEAGELFAPPRARVVVDDGRRFLARTDELYDVVVVDPPPPVHAAGSSLLYSVEFYALVRERLAPGGIVQQWIPGAPRSVVAAMVRAVTANFRHVRVFGSVEGWGLHILASQTPIEAATAEQLAARLPPAARADLLEWGPAATAADQFRGVLDREIAIDPASLAAVAPLRDDRPVNEYYLLRSTLSRRPPRTR